MNTKILKSFLLVRLTHELGDFVFYFCLLYLTQELNPAWTSPCRPAALGDLLVRRSERELCLFAQSIPSIFLSLMRTPAETWDMMPSDLFDWVGDPAQRNWQGEKVTSVSKGGHLLAVVDLCPPSPGLTLSLLYLRSQVTEHPWDCPMLPFADHHRKQKWHSDNGSTEIGRGTLLLLHFLGFFFSSELFWIQILRTEIGETSLLNTQQWKKFFSLQGHCL